MSLTQDKFVLTESETDNVLVDQKDAIWTEIGEISAEQDGVVMVNWNEFYFRASMVIAQLAILRRFWDEVSYGRKMNETVEMFTKVLRKKQEEHEERRATAKLAECLALQQKLDKLRI